MSSKQPPFEITNNIIASIAAISEQIGHLTASNHMSANPVLRRSNRIRTIQGSLAIEQNSLSLEQVTAVLNGRHVIAPPKDIAEVKNAYEVYEKLDELDPFSIDDLLIAHSVLTRGLVMESGEFRNGPVGVVDQEGHILHFGTLPQYVPDAVMNLMNWARDSDVHILIRSCVFHYELELIHPFADGNGRIGRLWHTLLLSKWNPLFAWLPIESLIHDHQQEYYDAINQSNAACESTIFIEFMLSIIHAALAESLTMIGAKPNKKQLRWLEIEAFLRTHEVLYNSDVQALCKVAPATASRILGDFTKKNKLVRCRVEGHWAYRKN